MSTKRHAPITLGKEFFHSSSLASRDARSKTLINGNLQLQYQMFRASTYALGQIRKYGLSFEAMHLLLFLSA